MICFRFGKKNPKLSKKAFKFSNHRNANNSPQKLDLIKPYFLNPRTPITPNSQQNTLTFYETLNLENQEKSPKSRSPELTQTTQEKKSSCAEIRKKALKPQRENPQKSSQKKKKKI